MPLLEVPALVGPRRLVSLPFSYAAGPFGASAADAALCDAARDLARERHLSLLEVKRADASRPPAREFVRSSRYSTYRVDTSGDVKDVWRRLHASSTQRSIKRAQKEGVVVVTADGIKDWRTMLALQERTSHRLGVPAPPPRFFLELCPALQRAGLARLYIARVPGGSVAAAIVLWLGRRDWIYAFGASDPRHLARRPNHILLWTALQDAMAAGRGFDMGRAASDQAGLVEFKQRWGTRAVPLAYDYWPRAAGINHSARAGGKLGMAAKVWSTLPFAVARRGNFLYRYLG